MEITRNNYYMLSIMEEEEQQRRKKAQEEEDRRRREQLQAMRYRRQLMSNNIPLFLKSEGYFCYEPDSILSSREFYDLYRLWCRDMGAPPESDRRFWLEVHGQREYLPIAPTSFYTPERKHARGYRGIRACKKASTE